MKKLLLLLMMHSALVLGDDGVESGEALYVADFEISGHTVMTTDDLQGMIDGHRNTPLYAEDLVAIGRSITDRYVAAGYINSGAVLEGLDGDTYRIRIIEGELTSLRVNTDGRLRETYIEKSIRSGLDSPLNIRVLQQSINHLERNPRVEYVKARLMPGANPGESILALDVFEDDPFTLRIRADNYLPPGIGDIQASVEIDHLNLSGRGDRLSVAAFHSDGADNGRLQYSHPFPASGMQLDLAYADGNTVVVEEPFDDIDIKSDTRVASIHLRKTVQASRDRSFSFSLGFEEKKSQSFLLNEPFDFAFGSRDGESRASVLVLQGEYQRSSAVSALVLRTIYRRGIDWFASSERYESDFDLLISQIQYSRRIDIIEDRPWLMVLRSNVQLTRDSLKSFERYPMGGSRSVRGYRENQLLRDNAFEISAELGIPLGSASSGFILSLFADHGRAWYSKAVGNEERFQTLGSVGLGLRYRRPSGLAVSLEWAARLSAKDKQGSSLQDDGFHIGLGYDF